MTLFVNDPDFTLYVGDALETLQAMPAESVHCVVTSPPYWGLRDYGTGSWEGGDTDCDHIRLDDERIAALTRGSTLSSVSPDNHEFHRQQFRDTCGKCGATRVDQQLGLESTPDEYVASMVNVFREVRRVLRADGTLWLNIGDSYASGGGAGNQGENGAMADRSVVGSRITRPRGGLQGGTATVDASLGGGRGPGLKPKDLVGIPWRLAFALQADGWYLRSDIIWSKPNPMPESVTDRPTKAHEYLFLLTKSPRYFYDADAIREPHSPDGRAVTQVVGGNGSLQHRDGERWPGCGRNKRSVWEIATEAYPDAHFATFPQALVEPCIKAGTSEHGCCRECGAPWERQVERVIPTDPGVINGKLKGNVPHHRGGSGRRLGQAYTDQLNANPPRTTGWMPTCNCIILRRSVEHLPPSVPCTVLDPFLGSGTTAQVARRLGRRSIGIELNPEYAELAARRLQQLSLFATETAEA